MFGKLFRSLRKGKIGADVYNLLLRNYSLEANHEHLTQYVDTFGEFSSNPHELAIGYLSYQISLMDSRNDKHIKLANKYVRVAKQAYEVGAASDPWFLDQLSEKVKDKLNLDVGTIKASAS